MDGDRERWNAKWRERAGELEDEATFLRDNAQLLPRRGKALDLAGGAGRNAVWLARRGLDVTLVDISDVALDKAERRATSLGVSKRLRAYHLDLELPLPFAPLFDVVLVMSYLDRERRDDFAHLLVTDGILVSMHPREGRYGVDLIELREWIDRLGFETLATHLGDDETGIIARRRAPVADPEPEPPDAAPSEGPYR